jgi:hypothetical protein
MKAISGSESGESGVISVAWRERKAALNNQHGVAAMAALAAWANNNGWHGQ